MVTRYFLRPLGIVIEETAFSLIAFQKMEDTKYRLDLSEQVTANPMVITEKGVQVRAMIQITDPEVIKFINADEADEDEDDDEEEEEVEEEKPRKRGRPSKKEVVEETEEETFEPLVLSIVVFNEATVVASSPLTESEPVIARMNKSEKNSEVIMKHLGRLAALVNRRDEILNSMEQESETISEELSSAVTDMIPGSAGRVDVLQASAVNEYRNRQRKLEASAIASINEELEFFSDRILGEASSEDEYEPFVEEVVLGDITVTPEEVVRKFFKEDFVRIG